MVDPNPGRTDGVGTLRKVSIGPLKEAYQYYDGEQFEDLTYHKAFQTDGDVDVSGQIDLHDIIITGYAAIESGGPELVLNETDAAADNRLWGLLAADEQFHIRAINDGVTISETAIKIDRTSYVIDAVYIGTGPEMTVDCGTGDVTFLGHLDVDGTGYSYFDGDIQLGQFSTFGGIRLWSDGRVGIGDKYPVCSDGIILDVRASHGVTSRKGIFVTSLLSNAIEARSSGASATFVGYNQGSGEVGILGLYRDVNTNGIEEIWTLYKFYDSPTGGAVNEGTRVRWFGMASDRSADDIAYMDCVQTDVTSSAQSADLRFSALGGGVMAELFRIDGDNVRCEFLSDVYMSSGDLQIVGVLDVDGTGDSTFAGDIVISGTSSTCTYGELSSGWMGFSTNAAAHINAATSLVLRTGAGGTMYFDFGGILYLRDADASYANRFEFNSANGNMRMDGVLDVDGTGTNDFEGDLDVAGTVRAGTGLTEGFIIGSASGTYGRKIMTDGNDIYLGLPTGNYLYITDQAGSSVYELDDAGNMQMDGDLQVDGDLTVAGTGNSLFSGSVDVAIDLVADGMLRIPYSTDNVSNPPTESELNTAFGTPGSGDWGMIGVLDDNGGGTDVYFCFTASDGGSGFDWYYIKATKA